MRAEMDQEKALSMVIPWIIVGVGILIALFHLRAQEKKKAQARAAARRHHDPGAFRKLDRDRNAKSGNEDEPEDID